MKVNPAEKKTQNQSWRKDSMRKYQCCEEYLFIYFFQISLGENIGCPFATQEESGFEDELPVLSFLSFDPIMVAEQFTLMDAVSMFPFLSCQFHS